MSDKPKVFKSITYSTREGGPALTVDPWSGGGILYANDSQLSVMAERHDIEEMRDLFQAALDDMEKDNG